MEWSRKAEHCLRAFLLGLAVVAHLAMVGAEPWTDESWERQRKGVDYTEQPIEEEEPTTEEAEEWNFEPQETPAWLQFLNSPGGRVLLFTVILGLLVFTILRLVAGRNERIRNERLSDDPAFSLDLIEENLEESDLERYLRLALEANDLKSAVRILYLDVLKNLHLRALIVWKKDKTNRDFLNEMRGHQSYGHLRDLTLAFEIVWYGDTEITREQFEHLRSHFAAYLQQLNDGRA